MLQVSDLRKAFGGVVAVEHASFEVHEGEIVGMIGPNGSGKSTCINVISGVYRPSSGTVRIAGEDVSRRPAQHIARRGVGRTFQLPHLLKEESVFANVLAGTYNRGRHGFLAALAGRTVTGAEEAQLEAHARRALEFVGLAHRAGVPARQLTGGETRQLELARVVASGAHLILLDEPAAGLNSVETGILKDRFARLRDQRHALLLVDHDMRLIMEVADRVVVLNHGQVIATGTPEQVQSNPEVVEAYLGRRRRKRKAAADG
jgi:ABC-type branched-subunit amino acid transport system ATPase component